MDHTPRKKTGNSGWLAIAVLILNLGLANLGCTEAPVPTLSYKERELVDSLFRLKVDSLRPLYDSLCTAHYDSALKFKVDSMMKVRREETQKYLDRLRKEVN